MSQLDPNLLIPLVAAVFGWLYHKVRGDKKQSLADAVSPFVGQAIHLVTITLESNIDTVRAKVADYTWDALTKAKIPRNALTESIVSSAIEEGIAYALEQARAHDRLVQVTAAKAGTDLAAAAKALGAELERLKSLPAPTPPDDVTIVPPSTNPEDFKPVVRL